MVMPDIIVVGGVAVPWEESLPVVVDGPPSDPPELHNRENFLVNQEQVDGRGLNCSLHVIPGSRRSIYNSSALPQG